MYVIRHENRDIRKPFKILMVFTNTPQKRFRHAMGAQ